MADAALLKKLLVRPGQRILVLNAPTSYIARLTPPPHGASLAETPDGAYDAVHAFVGSQADLARLWPTARDAIKPGGLVWLAYPKKTSGVKTDIHRDVGWDVVAADQWAGVTQIAIDDTWSALRFRPMADIPSMTRRF